MRRPIWEKRIPTLAALLLVAGSIFVTGYFLQQQTSTVGRASQDTLPQNITVTNITATSFTVVFTTQDPVIAGVSVTGPNMPESVFFSSPTQEEEVTHSISVPNLTPQTNYNFSILLQGRTILNDGQPFSVTTASELETSPLSQKISGQILTPQGAAAQNVLVIMKGTDSQIVSSITGADGVYTFDIGGLRTANLNSYASFASHSLLTLEAHHQDLASKIQVLYENIHQIPPITLSQNYNFGVVAEQDTATSDAQLTIPTPSITESTFSVTTPIQNQAFIDERPTFRGTVSPRSEVTLVIDSRDTNTVTSDNSGRWQLRPATPLSQGEHTLSISAKDAFGVTNTITRTFSIFPAGSQIAQTATPSATLTPTVTLTPTQSVSPTITSTPIPSPSITIPPTSIPSPTTTIAPTATVTPIPTTPPIITVTPTPPGSITTVLVTFTSVILIVAGTALLFILG